MNGKGKVKQKPCKVKTCMSVAGQAQKNTEDGLCLKRFTNAWFSSDLVMSCS